MICCDRCVCACTHHQTRRHICYIVSQKQTNINMSMGIVGVKSTAGREVKFIDPSKTTKSESTWLGYLLCAVAFLFFFFFCCFVFVLFSFLFCFEYKNKKYKNQKKNQHEHKHKNIKKKKKRKEKQHFLQWRTKVGGSKRIRYPRRPIFTSNDGLSIAYIEYSLTICPSKPANIRACSFCFFLFTECSPWFFASIVFEFGIFACVQHF